MKRVYTVKINGKTLESRNLKELLARAVSAKRNSDRQGTLKPAFYGRICAGDLSRSYAQSGMAAIH